jgi:hypothetical protein
MNEKTDRWEAYTDKTGPAPLALAGHQRGVGTRRPRCRCGLPKAHRVALAAAGVVCAVADARQVVGTTARAGASARPVMLRGALLRNTRKANPVARSSTARRRSSWPITRMCSDM